MAESYGSIFRCAMEASRPICGVLELTERCQQRCVFCLKGSKSPELDSPVSFWLRILQDLAEAGVFELQLSGGEPLLYSGFEEIVASAKSLGFRLLVTTNGNHDSTILGEWAKSIHRFRVSIHASEADLHDSIVGAQGAFRRAVEFCHAAKRLGAQVSIAYVINGMNVADIANAHRYFTEMGIKFTTSLQLLSNVETGEIDETSRITDVQLRSAALELDRLGLALPLRRAEEGWLCNAGRNTFSIGPDGTLYPCIVFRNPVANLHNTPFAAAWGSPELDAIRTLRDDQLPCFSCEYHDHCEFCPGEVWNVTRSMTAKVQTMCRTGIALAGVRQCTR